jgi:uncharacterized protein
MTPFRFGNSSRQMFGIHHAPTGRDRGEAVLMCNPFGQEMIRSHRLLKLFADRLARNGMHVMRFDYFGTGDSDGDDDQVDLTGLLQDVQAAHHELCRRSGAIAISWFGLRLGASVAALASANLSARLTRLVLLEPVLDGAQYVRELEHAHNAALKGAYGVRWFVDTALRTPLAHNEGKEALGFTISEQMRNALQILKPDDFKAAKSNNCQLLLMQDTTCRQESLTQVQKILSNGPTLPSMKTIPDSIVWTANEMLNAAVVSSAVLTALDEAFGERS